MNQADSTSNEPPTLDFLRSTNSHLFAVRVELFEGPIDLLLHLVKERELPLEKISLAQVTTQYLTCLEAMRNFDLEIAGEYLVIAATLVSIKSSILLNQPVDLVADEDGNLIDPHEELLRRLREASIYQDGARALGSRPMLGIDVFAGPSLIDEVEAPPVQYRPHDAVLLGRAFRKLIEKASKADPNFVVTIEHISIVERMRIVLDALSAAGGRLAFEKLVPQPHSRHSLVASFVAMLELCKRQVIAVQQAPDSDQIEITLLSINEVSVTLSELAPSEFDAVEEGGR